MHDFARVFFKQFSRPFPLQLISSKLCQLWKPYLVNDRATTWKELGPWMVPWRKAVCQFLYYISKVKFPYDCIIMYYGVCYTIHLSFNIINTLFFLKILDKSVIGQESGLVVPQLQGTTDIYSEDIKAFYIYTLFLKSIGRPSVGLPIYMKTMAT